MQRKSCKYIIEASKSIMSVATGSLDCEPGIWCLTCFAATVPAKFNGGASRTSHRSCRAQFRPAKLYRLSSLRML